MTQTAPPQTHFAGAVTPAALTVLSKLTFLLYHMNTDAFEPEPPQQISLDGVAATPGGHLRFTLAQAERREDFTTDGTRIVGRGGAFNPFERSELQQVLDTVCEATPGPDDDLLAGLRERLAERGFTLLGGPNRRYKYCFWMRSLRATHADGRVLWFAHYDEITNDFTSTDSIFAGPHWLGCDHNPHGEDTLYDMGLSDAEVDERRISVPEEVMLSRFFVSGDAIDALIQQQAAGWPADAELPHTVPAEFFSRRGEFADPQTRITREDQRAVRRARDALAQPGRQARDNAPDEELPF
jgi:hypothetical protein